MRHDISKDTGVSTVDEKARVGRRTDYILQLNVANRSTCDAHLVKPME